MKDLTTLIDAYFDGTIGDADFAELSRRIDGSAADAAAFARALYLHQAMSDQLADADAIAEPIVEDRPPLARIGLTLAVAAALLVGAVTVAVYVMGGASRSTDEPIGPAVAVVMSADDAVWRSEPLNPGDDVAAGVIEIDGGSVELSCMSGVTVKLSGPTRFTLASQTTGRLDRGVVRARVPQGATGFTVAHAAGWRVIDLGTEFGVECDERGRAHVHVFEGRVRIETADGLRREIAAGDAEAGVVIDEASGAGSLSAAGAWRFASPRHRVTTAAIDVPTLGPVTVVPPQITRSGKPRAEGFNTFPAADDAAFVLPPNSPAFAASDRWNHRPDFVRIEGVTDGSLHAWSQGDTDDASPRELMRLTTRHAVPHGRYAVYAVYAHRIDGKPVDDPGGITAALHGQPLAAFDASNGVRMADTQTGGWAALLAPLGETTGDELAIDVGRSASGKGHRTVYLGLAYRPIDQSTNPIENKNPANPKETQP